MMKPGTLVTSRERVYLDPPDMLVGEDGESSWSEILARDYKDIPFGPDEVGLVIFVRVTKLTNRTLWVKVLAPNGVGVCFADELEEVPLY